MKQYKIAKIKEFREKNLKGRYNLTLDKADAEEIQILLGIGLSPALQFIMSEFLEDWKVEMEEHGDWEEDPITKEERECLDKEYKEHPERWSPIEHLSEMKRRRMERGRYNLLKKEKRYSKNKKEKDIKK